MADWDDVDRLARELPAVDESTSYGNRAWKVKDKAFAWERPLRKSDLEALGDTAPGGPILGVRVEHLVAKEALLADDPGVYFTTPHFDGYPAVLVRLGEISPEELEELYVVTAGTLTMRFGDDVHQVPAGTAVRVAPKTPRSHRNEGDVPVEIWAVSRSDGMGDSHKLDDFWEASPDAAQTR